MSRGGTPTRRELCVISLGAGVQSSTMALMAAVGEITPMPDCAIFADTGAEPQHVYDWLNWLEKQLPFPVYRVMHKDGLRENIIASVTRGQRIAQPPFYADVNANSGPLRRACTTEFKVAPITQKVRALLGAAKGERIKGKPVTQWIGISWDEVQRMKQSRERWIEHCWPLIELRMTRQDCLKWMADHGYPKPAKSSCTFCPYHDDALWRDMKLNDPESWADAVNIDKLIRGGVRGTTQKLYLHRSLKPLDEVDFRNAEDAGQYRLFGNDCTGMCGV